MQPPKKPGPLLLFVGVFPKHLEKEDHQGSTQSSRREIIGYHIQGIVSWISILQDVASK